MNYLSGARTWTMLGGGNTSRFDTYPVNLMKKGVRRLSKHITMPAPPLTPADITQIVKYLQAAGPEANVLVAAILMGYSTLLRQSNLLATTSANDPGHWLRRSDVNRTAHGLSVAVRSTKTTRGHAQSFEIHIPMTNTTACTVRAWDRYAAGQRLRPSQPAFMLPRGGPLLAPTLLAALRLGVGRGGRLDSLNYTLHSLRRGGAQASAAAGSSLQDVMTLGSWSSNAVYSYVPRRDFRSEPSPPE